MRCSIKGCTSHLLPQHVSLHRLFRGGQYREDWIQAIMSLNSHNADSLKVSKSFVVCDMHFNKSCLINLGPKTHLKSDAIPTIFPNMLEQTTQNLVAFPNREKPGINDLSESEIIDYSLMNFASEELSTEEFNRLIEYDGMDNTYYDQPSTSEVNVQVDSAIIDYKSFNFATEELSTEELNSLISYDDIDNSFNDQPSTSKANIHVDRDLPANISTDFQSSIISTPSRKVLDENAHVVRSRKRKFDPDQASPRTLKRKCLLYKEIIRKKDNTLRVLRRKLKSQEKKIGTLNSLVMELEKKNLISENGSEILQTYDNSLIEVLRGGKITGKYPVELRSFALTLHFYSPRAYKYIRSLSKNNLPAESTLRSWYSQTDVGPGYTKKSLDVLTLKSISLLKQNRKLVACLMMDEMAIRQHMQWDDSKKKFVGTIDYGTDFSSTEELPPAKEALVYLLVGMNGAWKLPVAYFLCNGLRSSEKASFTRQVVSFLSASNIEIIGLTFDGHPGNIGMLKHLGTSLENFEPNFKNPENSSEIAIFLDACHCIKLVRNTWGTKKIIFDGTGKAIKWEFIEKLVNYQGELGLHFANKLNQRHLNWHSKIMNVKLAAETLSESAANALSFLRDKKVPGFEGCEATIIFLKKINSIFDCLNTKSKFGFGFKKGLCDENKTSVFDFFEESINYLSELNLGNEKIIYSKSKVGFIGFIVDMRNLKNIYRKHVEEKKNLEYILSYKLSQDHLELFFSSIRSRGGFNNNPTSAQFASAYKRLLIHNEVRSSAEANCISCDETSILIASSSQTKNKFEFEIGHEDEDILVLEGMSGTPLNNSPMEDIISYISGFVEFKIIKSIHCKKCKEFLLTSEKSYSKLISLKSKGFLRYPHRDTIKICKIVKQNISILEKENKLTNKNLYLMIGLSSLRNLDLSLIYKELDRHILDCDIFPNHKYELIKEVIQQCSKVLLHYIAKKNNIDDHKKLVRNRLTKIVQFMGQ